MAQGVRVRLVPPSRGMAAPSRSRPALTVGAKRTVGVPIGDASLAALFLGEHPLMQLLLCQRRHGAAVEMFCAQ
jgi:hypothetical protein